jgi:preprotein translocase subunit SecE
MAVAKSEKQNLFTKVKKSFRNTVQEMKRVHWPGKRDLAIYTVVVIGVSLVMSLFIYILDSGIGALMKLILK